MKDDGSCDELTQLYLLRFALLRIIGCASKMTVYWHAIGTGFRSIPRSANSGGGRGLYVGESLCRSTDCSRCGMAWVASFAACVGGPDLVTLRLEGFRASAPVCVNMGMSEENVVSPSGRGATAKRAAGSIAALGSAAAREMREQARRRRDAEAKLQLHLLQTHDKAAG